MHLRFATSPTIIPEKAGVKTMTKENLILTASSEATTQSSDDTGSSSRNGVKRRSFLKGIGVAGAAFSAAPLLAAASKTAQQSGVITSGDVAILSFLAAAEL